MASKRNFTHDEIELMVSMYQDGYSMKKIGDTFNTSPTTIHYRLQKIEGFTARTQKETSRKYTADWDYFETIDTEAKAYWLGFLYADGYISKSPSNLMGVSLAEKDYAHLCKLQADLNATNPIIMYEPSSGYGKDPYVRFTVISDKMVKDLERHGITSNKTNVLQPPTTVPEDLIHHFIRGYFDGDGGWSKTGKTIGYKFTLTGTEEMVLWVAEKLDIIPRLYQRWPDRGVNNYTLEAQAKSDLAKIIPYLYKDLTASNFLARKFDLAMKIRPLVEESTSAHSVNSGKA